MRGNSIDIGAARIQFLLRIDLLIQHHFTRRDHHTGRPAGGLIQLNEGLLLSCFATFLNVSCAISRDTE